MIIMMIIIIIIKKKTHEGMRMNIPLRSYRFHYQWQCNRMVLITSPSLGFSKVYQIFWSFEGWVHLDGDHLRLWRSPKCLVRSLLHFSKLTTKVTSSNPYIYTSPPPIHASPFFDLHIIINIIIVIIIFILLNEINYILW